MGKGKSKGKRSGSKRRSGVRPRKEGGGRREWVGGVLPGPGYVLDREEPYRPDLVIWMELPDRMVVGHDLVAPEERSGALGRVLGEAMRKPMMGPPRRPPALRISDSSLVEEVRAVAGGTVPVRIAPTPELDELLHLMQEGTARDEGEDPGWLGGGRIRPEVVEDLFEAARLLYGIAPWKAAADGQVLRMDIPELGVEGACLSIIGNMEISTGVLIFPSLEGYLAFSETAEEQLERNRIPNLGTNWISLSFEPEEDLPPVMRREMAEYDWPVAGPEACPEVRSVDADLTLRPLTEKDLKIAAACARSLTAFFVKHRDLFEQEEIEPVCESYFDENDLEVRFTVPYETLALFNLEEPSRTGSVGLPDEDEYDRHPLHDLDHDVVTDLVAFARRDFGPEFAAALDDFTDPMEEWQLAEPWSVYEYPLRGRSAADRYLEESAGQLDERQRGWLEAQRSAWLSVWEVTAVEEGISIGLQDLLSGEQRTVEEAAGSRTLGLRDAILGRVVDFEGTSLLCGVHPRPLPPREASDVVRRVRRRLRRKRAIPPDRLREPGIGGFLIRTWGEAVQDLDRRFSKPPVLQNTDGDPLKLTTDIFEVAPGRRKSLEARLAGWPDVDVSDDGDGTLSYAFLKERRSKRSTLENVLVGRGFFEEDRLHLETNSLKRADALRERLESAFGGHLEHRERVHLDLSSAVAGAGARSSDRLPEPSTPELAALTRELKQQHYADWIDQPLPALKGMTPREAVRTASGREAVEILIKEMENMEGRLPESVRFDFSELRRKLDSPSAGRPKGKRDNR